MCFAESITFKQKVPKNLPHSKQFFKCKSKNVIYLIICTTPGYGAQYVGYTTRGIINRISKHLNEGPMMNHIKQENHDYKKIKFQILVQAPTHETDRALVKTT